MLTGGDEVYGAHGTALRVSHTFWGVTASPYPMGPTTTVGLADHLETSLSAAVASRIDWLGIADSSKVEAWIAAHPDFAGAVVFVAPERAARLWEGLAAESTAGTGADPWMAAPLAQLLALAPFAVNNLNGLRAEDRTRFNRETLKQLLARDDLDDKHRGQLRELDDMLKDASGSADQTPVFLLSLFLETDDNSPRASLGFGDVDNADQITTLTHGIETDMASLGEWADSAVKMEKALSRALTRADPSAESAVVLFMEWDSGGTSNAWNIERPGGGAERLAQLQRGFEVSSPGAQRNLGLHSLATTAGAQMIADNPELVDNVWLYGSAGVTEDAARALERQISQGTLSVRCTPLMRQTISSHPSDGDRAPSIRSTLVPFAVWTPSVPTADGSPGTATAGVRWESALRGTTPNAAPSGIT
ncbi:hypothetical protein RS85_02912 [Microbacterium sp. SA39]|nr:hypothetical protein RS85_02912 [Microbacterium sp. SA39]